MSLSASTGSGSEKTLRFGKGPPSLAYPEKLRALQEIEPVRRLDELAVKVALQGPAYCAVLRIKALEQGGRIGMRRGMKADDEVLLVRPGHGSPIVHAVRREEVRRFQMGLPEDVGLTLDVPRLSLAVPLQIAAEEPGAGLVVQKGITDELLRAGSPGPFAGKGEAVPPLGLRMPVIGHHPPQFVVGGGQIDGGIEVAPRAVGGHDAQGVAFIGIAGLDLHDASRQPGLTLQQRAGVHPLPRGKVKGEKAAFVQHKEEAADFAEYLLSNDVAMEYFEQNGMPPVTGSASSLDEVKNDAYLQGFLAATETAKLEETAMMTDANEIKSIITEELQAALLGSKSAEDAVADMTTRLESL